MNKRGGMMKSNYCVFVLVVFLLGVVVTAPVEAFTISGTSSSSLVTDVVSPHYGLYKYTINMVWDFTGNGGHGMSHLTLRLLSVTCPYAIYDEEGEYTVNFEFEPSPDPLVYLSGTDGLTTDEDYPGDATLVVDWYGITDTADNTTGSTGPLIKYEQPLLYVDGSPLPEENPGVTGEGEFWFYSVFAPTDNNGDPWVDALAAKSKQDIIIGTLTGDLPYCIPEPATLALLGLGGLLLRKKRS